MEELKQRLMHLFLSRRFMVLVISTVLVCNKIISGDVYLWIILAVLGTNTVDKFKNQILETVNRKK
jgi:hypothetical protein